MRGCIEITFKDVVNNSTFYKGFNTTTIFKITVKISNFIKDKERHTKHLQSFVLSLFFLVKFLFAATSENKQSDSIYN